MHNYDKVMHYVAPDSRNLFGALLRMMHMHCNPSKAPLQFPIRMPVRPLRAKVQGLWFRAWAVIQAILPTKRLVLIFYLLKGLPIVWFPEARRRYSETLECQGDLVSILITPVSHTTNSPTRLLTCCLLCPLTLQGRL